MYVNTRDTFPTVDSTVLVFSRPNMQHENRGLIILLVDELSTF